MKIYVHSAKDYAAFNYSQTVVGSPLRTLKGSVIKRCPKYGVGKEIGGDVYVHKDYMDRVVPDNILNNALDVMTSQLPGITFNTIKYNPRTQVVTFMECPDFNTAREPMVGTYTTVDDRGRIKQGYSKYIYHHKWLWVTNEYDGFDVAESWEWSKQWLSVLTEPADGNGIQRWNAQLNKFNLPLDN